MMKKMGDEVLDECMKERYGLAKERIREIRTEETVKEPFGDFFRNRAKFLSMAADVMDESAAELTMEALKERNHCFYQDILPENYESSYGNPAYAVNKLGDYGKAFSFLYAELAGTVAYAHEKRLWDMTVSMELFLEVYSAFCEEELPEAATVEGILRSYVNDYCQDMMEQRIREGVDPELDFAADIIMNSDLSDLRYLYRYGEFVSENETGVAEFLNSLSQEEIDKMASTYTEGYRIGFEVTGKDLGKKQTVQLRYPIGFERMVRAAVRNFEKMNLKPTMLASATSPNKQFDYDHSEDRALYLDKAYVERCLEARKNYFEEEKKLAAGHAGPAVIEVFGEVPFSPENKERAVKYNEKQQKICVYEMNMAGQMINEYIKGEERSFTIIAYPIPEIGDRFEEIFAETVKLNTLDYKLYQTIQQKIIDVLDTADQVHITGKGKNKTDLYVNIWKLKDPAKETAFENCVADVNIPVGEVFTSPVLEKTTGILFVGQVYLNGLNYENLEIRFKDGMVESYTCTNFKDEAENKKYIRDNVLKHHDTLPMGEFAIGTNTTAYRMARDYQIADKLPILIAEKTGPHFAVGDTCYSHEEDNVSYNPDGKAIVARENSVSAQRKESVEKAYLNCHTDITIPYDELDKITVIRKDGSTEDIIADGKFVLVGTEQLNEPLL